MKPKEYILKFKLDKGLTRDKVNAFMKELGNEFKELVPIRMPKQSITQADYNKFQHVVTEIKSKWDGVNKKIPGSLTDHQWNFFFASYILPVRNELFPNMENKYKEIEFEKLMKSRMAHLEEITEDELDKIKNPYLHAKVRYYLEDLHAGVLK